MKPSGRLEGPRGAVFIRALSSKSSKRLLMVKVDSDPKSQSSPFPIEFLRVWGLTLLRYKENGFINRGLTTVTHDLNWKAGKRPGWGGSWAPTVWAAGIQSGKARHTDFGKCTLIL